MSYLSSRAVVLETCLQSESSFFIVCLRNFRSTPTGQECFWGLRTISDLPFCVEMFSSKRHLETKTPVDGVGRLEFLQQLVTEFQTSNDNGGKNQVLANLANFAYDPINYEHLRKLNVVDLFLDTLTEPDEKQVEFGLGGLCNVALERGIKDYIISSGGVKLIIDVLSRTEEEILVSAITTLMFLMTPQSKAEITAPSVVQCMQRFSQATNKRLSNLANVFLQDYCSDHQRLQAQTEDGSSLQVFGIPLPDQLPSSGVSSLV
ncbi:armadillo repeat-containing protein 7-like [Asterias amurensis]|uniref:armadillo repeat-containing protein 7-like n=1 Tax=Asterias amurensis TaxID=7602 RepID=UPI003AB8B922